MPAPICVFTYNRLAETRRTLEALQRNSLASQSELFLISDGPDNVHAEEKVNAVRAYLKTVTGFKTIHIFEANTNRGLAQSIIQGVSQVLIDNSAVIVLEDDLVTSENFLAYMNQALTFYEFNTQIFSIAGYSVPLDEAVKQDVYFTKRSSSWGWATWKPRWEKVDWEVKDYPDFKRNLRLRMEFNKMGSDMAGMLDKQMQGKISSWAIRWCFHQFKEDLYSVHPTVSRVQNIGFNNSEATHTKEKYNRFETVVDKSDKKIFTFIPEPYLDKDILKQFLRPYTIEQRIKYKIMNKFF